MAVLEYNGSSIGVCLDEVSIQRASIRQPGTGAVLGHKGTWAVAGTLIGDTASLLSQVAALEAAYDDDGHDLVLKTETDGTVLHQLDSSTAADGVRITQRPSFPTLKGAEFASKRGITLAAEAEFYDGDPDLLVDDQSWDYQVGQDGKATRTVNGTLETKAGVSAAGYFAACDPGTPAGYTRGRSGHQENDDDTRMGYKYVDVEHWQALPTGVLEGGYTQTVSESGGVKRLAIAGRFVGPTASVLAAIAALRQSSRKLLGEKITTEPFGGAKSFSLEYEYGDSSLLSYRETVTVEAAYTPQVYRRVLGGGQPVRQEVARTTALARVSGRAIGRDSFPAFPTSLWPTMYYAARPRKGWVGPERTADGRHVGYEIQWELSYEFPLTVTTRLPRVR